MGSRRILVDTANWRVLARGPKKRSLNPSGCTGDKERPKTPSSPQSKSRPPMWKSPDRGSGRKKLWLNLRTFGCYCGFIFCQFF